MVFIESGHNIDARITPIKRRISGMLDFPIALRNVSTIVWEIGASPGPTAANLPVRVAGDILVVWVFAVANDPKIPTFVDAGRWVAIENSGSYAHRIYQCVATNDANDGASTGAVLSAAGYPRGIVMASFKNDVGAYISKTNEYSYPGASPLYHFIPKTGVATPGAEEWLQLPTGVSSKFEPAFEPPTLGDPNWFNPPYAVFTDYKYDPAVGSKRGLIASAGWRYLTGADAFIDTDRLYDPLQETYFELARTWHLRYS